MPLSSSIQIKMQRRSKNYLLYDPRREGGHRVEGETDMIELMCLVDRLNVVL